MDGAVTNHTTLAPSRPSGRTIYLRVLKPSNTIGGVITQMLRWNFVRPSMRQAATGHGLLRSISTGSKITLETSLPHIIPGPTDEKTSYRYLGLDINTKSTGFTVLDAMGHVVECGVWAAPKTFENKLEYGLFFRGNYSDLAAKHGHVEWIVGVEKFLQGFSGTTWTTKSLFHIAQVNMLAMYECVNTLGRTPIEVHPTEARTAFGISHSRAATRDGYTPKLAKKLAVYDMMMPLLDGKVEWRIKRTGKLHEDNFDITDSALISMYALGCHRASICRSHGPDILPVLAPEAQDLFEEATMYDFYSALQPSAPKKSTRKRRST